MENEHCDNRLTCTIGQIEGNRGALACVRVNANPVADLGVAVAQAGAVDSNLQRLDNKRYI